MSGRRHRSAQHGQATVEYVGIATILVLLLASVSIWVMQNVRPPAEPPPVIESIANHLDAQPPGLPEYVFRSGVPEGMLRPRGDGPIGKFLRGVRDTVRDVVVIGGPALARGFGTRIRERTVEMVRDPIGTVRDTLEEIGHGDPNILRAIRNRIGDIGDYVHELRGMSREEMIRKVAGDLGAAGADIVVEQGRAFIVRSAIKRGRSRTTQGGAPPGHDPPSRE
jgi:hypothetical protein